jgi:hypothetical protein
MSHFEYLSVAVSMILSLGVLRLLDSLRFVVDPEGRWGVVVAWIAIKLLNHVVFWWALWTAHERENWNILLFSWTLLFPAVLYLQVTALVTTTPQTVRDWRAHFFEVRRWFFTANLILLAQTVVSATVMGALTARSFYSTLVLQGILFAVNVIGLASANPRVHVAIVTVVLCAQTLGFGSIFFSVDAGGPP